MGHTYQSYQYSVIAVNTIVRYDILMNMYHVSASAYKINGQCLHKYDNEENGSGLHNILLLQLRQKFYN